MRVLRWAARAAAAAAGGGCRAAHEWALAVRPRGRLAVRLPCQVRVRPLEPPRAAAAERVLVSLSGAERGAPRLRVSYDEAREQVAIVADGLGASAAVDVRTPLQFDLDIKTSGTGCVKIQKIECDNCSIETEKGTSVLQSIKSHKINIRTNGGKVIGLGTLYGNTDIHATEKGGKEKLPEPEHIVILLTAAPMILPSREAVFPENLVSVSIEKLQGASINISTEDGLLKTKYLYAESSSLSSETGDILLGSIHGNTTLQTKTGSITVDSSDGSLKASTDHGSIDVYVSQLRKVDLKSQKGSIKVKVPASLKAHLQLSGRKVDVSSEIHLEEPQSASKDDHVTISGRMNQGDEADKWIKADAQNGKVSLKSQSWIQSVKLKDT